MMTPTAIIAATDELRRLPLADRLVLRVTRNEMDALQKWIHERACLISNEQARVSEIQGCDEMILMGVQVNADLIEHR